MLFFFDEALRHIGFILQFGGAVRVLSEEEIPPLGHPVDLFQAILSVAQATPVRHQLHVLNCNSNSICLLQLMMQIGQRYCIAHTKTG